MREHHGWTVDELRCYVSWAKALGQSLTMSNAAEQVSAGAALTRYSGGVLSLSRGALTAA